MRYTKIAVALCLLAGVSASTAWSAPGGPFDPRALALEGEGRAALGRGDINAATDAFEAALAVEPGSGVLVMDLAQTARAEGMPGKALHYYRAVLDRDPRNVMAVAGEGEALVEKGALDKARQNLAKLQSMCGVGCPATEELAAAIARGPAPRMVDAAALKPKASAN